MSKWLILSNIDIENECKHLGLPNKSVEEYKKFAAEKSKILFKLPSLQTEKSNWFLLCDETVDCQYIKPAFENIQPLFQLLNNLPAPVKITYYEEFQINTDTFARFIWGTTNKYTDIIYNNDADIIKPAVLNYDGDTNFYQSVCIYSTKTHSRKIQDWFGEFYAYDKMVDCNRIFLYNKPKPPHDIVYIEMLKTADEDKKCPFIFNINIEQPGLSILPPDYVDEFLDIYNSTLDSCEKEGGSERLFLDLVKRNWYRFFTPEKIKTTTKKIWENINLVYTSRGTQQVF